MPTQAIVSLPSRRPGCLFRSAYPAIVVDPEGNYAARRITFQTFDSAGIQVMRLNFKPVVVTAGPTPSLERKDLKEPGYPVEANQGDCIVRLRHAGSTRVVVEGRCVEEKNYNNLVLTRSLKME